MRKPTLKHLPMKGIEKAKAKIHNISERAQAKVAAAEASEHKGHAAPPKKKAKGANHG